MVGWDDDAFHSQVIYPSENSESIMCFCFIWWYVYIMITKRAVSWTVIVVWDGVCISYLNMYSNAVTNTSCINSS